MADGYIDFSPVIRAIDQANDNIITVNKNISVLGNDLDRVSDRVGLIDDKVDNTQSELAELRRQFEEYVKQAERTANVQRAETKVGTLKADLEREFGHYKVVRRSSIGLLQAFDVGNVSESTASQISEELMIQTPRYWLAPALVALAAWSRDDKDICERSITEAYNRSQAKTALFFALVLRREKREAESVRWLHHYLPACDPRALTREFAVILEAASQGQFGPRGTQLALTQLAQWTAELRDSQELVANQVAKWVEELTVNQKVLDPSEAPMLRRLASAEDFARVKAQAEATTALKACAEKYEAIKDSEFTSTGVISTLLDDLLIQLVTEYDEEELPLNREVAYQDAIIETGGDLERARTKADQMISVLDERTDAVTLQTNAAIAPDSLGVSVRTQQVAIGVGKDDFRTAVRAYTKNYRSRHVDNVTLTLAPNHHQLAATYGFRGFTTSTQTDEAVMAGQLRQVWDATFAAYIQSVTFKNQQMIMPIGIALGVTLIAFVINPLAGLLVALIAGGLAYYVIYQAQKAAQAKVNEANVRKQRAYEESFTMLQDARADFDELQWAYEEQDADEDELLRVIDVWPSGETSEKEN